MRKLVTRDKEDYELFTITISSSNDFEIFEAISDTYTELMNNASDTIIASEEITITAERIIIIKRRRFFIKKHGNYTEFCKELRGVTLCLSCVLFPRGF